ncbi:hypothetical protein TNCV_4717731 [Trichonephila clavipes]|nr:hypothetical protein TNCV_4717731 [Trichonephila clavipes]
MDKCIVPFRHGGTSNSCRAVSPLERLVEGEERRKVPDHPQNVLPQNRGGTEPNRTVTCSYSQDNPNFACVVCTELAIMCFVSYVLNRLL